MAYFHKRNGKHAFTIDLGKDPLTGKRRQTTRSGFDKISEAKKAARTIENEIDDGTYGVTNMKFKELYELWKSQATQRQTTLEQKDFIIKRHVLPYIGEKRIDDISPVQMQYWINQLRSTGKLSDSSIHNYRRIANTIFNYAVRIELLNKSPLKHIKVDYNKKDKHIWSEKQTAVFLKFVKENSRYWLAHYFALLAGMRVSEIAGLKKEDIVGNKLHIRRAIVKYGGEWHTGPPKTKKSERVNYLSDFFIEQIEEYKEEYPFDEWFFPGRFQEYVTTNGLRVNFYNMCDRAGLPRIQYHGMRASYITYLLDNGVPVHIVAEMVGHNDSSVTLNSYATPLDDKLLQAADTTNSLLRGTNSGTEEKESD